MELRRYFAILRSRALVILVTVLVGLAVGYATTNKTSRYTATSTIYVGSRQLVGTAGGISNDQLLGLQRISATFATMIDSYPIALDAVNRSRAGRSAETLQAQLAATPETGTQLLHVSVTDTQPEAAQVLANAVVDSFVEKITTFEPGESPGEGAAPALPAYVFERARLPTAPRPTDLTRNLIIDGGFALVLAIALAFLLDYLDVTIKTPAEVERRLELPVLGAIPLEPHPELFLRTRSVHAT